MSAAEETKGNIGVKATWQTSFAAAISNGITKLLNLLSSVRFGVTLLVLLVIGSMIGMLVMQQSVEGFDKYFAELTPSQQLLYGKLGWFDIYHIWYFNALLLVLSLNIVLASIDRFPKAWTFISRPKLDASANWLRGQEQSAVLKLEGESRQSVAARIAESSRSIGFKSKVTEKGTRTFVFAQKNVLNRLGAYAVHVALLTIFTGGFLTAQFGSTGMMWIKPGASSSTMTESVHDLDQQKPVTLQLPFEVYCTDIQQKLIRNDGPITADNTVDWLSRIKIKDADGAHEALVHMNQPFDYRGYRFFQASFAPLGKARTATVRLTPEKGGAPLDVTIPRDGSATLPDGTVVALADFRADFSAGPEEDGDTSDYSNPAAILKVKTPQGQTENAFAFSPAMAENAPIAKKPVGGYTYRLIDFERVPFMHALSIQHDPGSPVVYLGFLLLALTLVNVFFFSHQRIWALIEEKASGSYEVTMGGNTNRNRLAFEGRFKRLAKMISGQPHEEES
ncbi:MAG: cytochrome c biosis protein [Acidobacteriota bacterium]|jgi:cytochrome c biogenesis protein|nr:cytochrome c biosis protein [Acidobacteriota bacterium]